jgi:hypothetical protein
VAERPSALPPVFGEERLMPHEELHLFSDDRLLLTMSASVNDARDTVRRTLELIEQTRSILRELDVRGVGGPRVS